jgi:hypothetical protein
MPPVHKRLHIHLDTTRREGLGLSFYQCRRRLIAGKLSLDLSPLLPVQVEAV